MAPHRLILNSMYFSAVQCVILSECVTGFLYLLWFCVSLSERLTDAGLLG